MTFWRWERKPCGCTSVANARRSSDAGAHIHDATRVVGVRVPVYVQLKVQLNLSTTETHFTLSSA